MAIAVDANFIPLVAAARYGGGRLVSFGHEGMLADNCCSSTGLGRLVLNAGLWAASGDDAAAVVRVAGSSAFMTGSAVAGLVKRSPGRFRSVGTVAPAALGTAAIDLYVINGQDQAAGDSAGAIRRFVAAGGGVLIGAQTWYWASLDKPVVQHPANRLLQGLGVYLAPEVVQGDATLHPTKPPPQAGHALGALGCIQASVRGATASPCFIASEDGLGAAMQGLAAQAALVPQAGALGAGFWSAISKLANSSTVTNPERPVKRRSLAGLAALARNIQLLHLPPAQLGAAPDARFFPGLPPAGTKPTRSPIVRQIIGTTPSVRYGWERFWRCLATYALPGKAATVRIPKRLVNAGLRLRVGGWDDTGYHKPEWRRLPQPWREFAVTAETTTIGSSLGGLIYLVLPPNSKLGTIQVEVAGAIRAPYFVAGETAASSWEAEVAHPAPWGELGSSKLVMAAPSSALRTVKDAAGVAGFWDQVMDSHAWVAAVDPNLAHPNRVQFDPQVGYGYLHAGYPISAPAPIAGDDPILLASLHPTEPAYLPDGYSHWGMLHELGHNKQEAAWTWSCAGEVGVNLFSSRAQYAVVGNTDPASFYGWFSDRTSRYAARDAYFASGPSMQKLCDKFDVALDSLLQVLEEGGFGWELIRKTIASYRALRPDQLPTSDGAKINTWVVQQSKAAGVNLAAYYQGWGYQVSEATRQALRALPVYRPKSG